ncbi:hypothetical protein BC834DRAFT_974518 [Gloeopeniophorella convolvens]|nr:hypothetical protein BC834DRAFT_974518 [Gloeopeniophorella convolvens]
MAQAAKRMKADIAEKKARKAAIALEKQQELEQSALMPVDVDPPRVPTPDVVDVTCCAGVLPKDLQDLSLAVAVEDEERWGKSVDPTAHLELPSTRSGHRCKFPAHYVDFVPSCAAPACILPPHPPTPPRPPTPTPEPSPPPPEIDEGSFGDAAADELEVSKTEVNDFGVYRVYSTAPTYDPEQYTSLDDLCDTKTLSRAPTSAASRRWWAGFGASVLDSVNDNIVAPFINVSVFRLMHWFYGSNTKSLADLDRLVNDVILADDFNRDDFRVFSAQRELRRLDNVAEGTQLDAKDGWLKASVKFTMSPGGAPLNEGASAELVVDGVFYREVLEVTKGAWRDITGLQLHQTPFQQHWQDPNDPTAPPVRIYSELYNSDAVLEEHERVRMRSQELGCQLEACVAVISLWSDATHLTSFSNASLWPIYLYFGNLSKYVRAKPTAFAAHHLAYIPNLPETLTESYQKAFGRPPTPEVLNLLKRDLMQAVWALILEGKFMDAYVNGIVLMCADGVYRRVYPRFFTYSADYPKKALLACIKNLGHYPCPCCYVEKSQIYTLGTKADMRRRRARAREDDILSAWVQRILELGSLVPAQSTFSRLFLEHGFNFYTMFVPDLLHEFELGVWKNTFIHLLRLLCARGGDTIQMLNARFRQIPTFGRGTIRRFGTNVADLKKIAARDFEDILQCSIPVFEGLFPSPHNEIVLDLLFVMSTWHTYAKLRIHTDQTLTVFESVTTALGKVVRKFAATICQDYKTVELRREISARGRLEARMAAKKVADAPPPADAALEPAHGVEPAQDAITTTVTTATTTATTTAAAPATALATTASTTASTAVTATTATAKKKKTPAKDKQFKVHHTYKFHRLGDYPASIRTFGPSDNYSTQTGELEHRRVKRFYARTNKNDYTQQISQHEQRKRVLNTIDSRLTGQAAGAVPPAAATTDEELPPTIPRDHHHIGESNNIHFNLIIWLQEHRGDPAVHKFRARLQDHLLARCEGRIFDGDEHEYTDEERSTIQFANNRLFPHKTMRVNYTTYDMRRDQDTINVDRQCNIMVLAHEDEGQGDPHPYWYARVIGIFHAYIRHRGSRTHAHQALRMEFLWVRWYGRDMTHRSGFSARRLPRIGFLPSDDSNYDAFGFLDPQEVIHAVHLIPAFAHGHTLDLLPPGSIGRRPNDEGKDWVYQYVNMFPDRDMFMRFVGQGIGHTAIRKAIDRMAQETTNALSGSDNVPTANNAHESNIWVDLEDEPNLQMQGTPLIIDEGLDDDALIDLGSDKEEDDPEDECNDIHAVEEDDEEYEGFAPY